MHEHDKMRRIFNKTGLLLLLVSFALPAQGQGVYVVVDTDEATLTVLQDGAVLQVFEDIAIGRFGVTRDKQRGDNMTPLGNFRIGWITAETRYHRFAGINYPTYSDATRGLADGTISRNEWRKIRKRLEAGRVPPQTTPLGGYLGIHGIGAGDIEVHRAFNWTNGCVAMTNEQMDRLLELVQVGTPVEIR